MQSTGKENSLYEPVKGAAGKMFDKFLSETYLEVTASKGPSNRLKKHLPDYSIFTWSVEKFKPDIMGYAFGKPVQTIPDHGTLRLIINIIIEVKSGALAFNDIYQLKGYAEVYNAAIALLISDVDIPEEMKRILELRPQLLNTSALHGGKIIIGKFDAERGVLDGQAWYPTSPL